MTKSYSPKLMGLAIMACAFAYGLTPLSARAAEVEVQMLTSGKGGETNVFQPGIVHVKPGDSVHFVATDKGHNVQSIKSMTPDGAEPFRSQISQDLVVKFDKPGVYGYYCLPHYSLGMVGLVVVGAPTNEDSAKAGMNSGTPSLAKAKFTKLFNELDTH